MRKGEPAAPLRCPLASPAGRPRSLLGLHRLHRSCPSPARREVVDDDHVEQDHDERPQGRCGEDPDLFDCIYGDDETPTQPAPSAPVSSPPPVSTRMTAMIIVTQPQVVRSAMITPWPPTTTTLSFTTAA